MIVTVRGILAERLFNDLAPAGEKRYLGWLVAFDTAHGSGRAWWMGAGFLLVDDARPAPPSLDTPHAVEIESGGDFTWDVDALIPPEPCAEPRIALDGTAMLLHGTLAGTDAHGIATVQIGDAAVAVTVHGEPPHPGTAIVLRARRLFLYPL